MTNGEEVRYKSSVTISFYGENLDPDVITKRLELNPTLRRRVGEKRITAGGREVASRTSVWQYEISLVTEHPQVNDLTRQLTKLLQPRATEIAEIRKEADDCCIDYWIEVNHYMVAFSLDASALRALTEFAGRIDFRLLAMGAEWPPEDR